MTLITSTSMDYGYNHVDSAPDPHLRDPQRTGFAEIATRGDYGGVIGKKYPVFELVYQLTLNLAGMFLLFKRDVLRTGFKGNPLPREERETGE
ncbi:hypothetical protein TNCV_4942201 [Trichonephila clavipes]|nr:hypothetical protein TNCV_4942201 [Trichonephila clavipes]